MGSMIYEINQLPLFQSDTGGKATTNSLADYKKRTLRFAKWLKSTHHVKHLTYDPKVYVSQAEYQSAFQRYIQEYANVLVADGKYSDNTIYDYVVGPCRAYNINSKKIDKPTRKTSKNTRSRGHKAMDMRSDAKREASPRLFNFSECVGIRRHEYQALHSCNLKLDESGYPCIEVVKGKGGKYQLQRILPQYIPFVEAYFDGSKNFVFDKQEMNNKIDLHANRAKVAKEAYAYYVNRLKKEPVYREQLLSEIKERWSLYAKVKNKKKGGSLQPRPWNEKEFQGQYILRGDNRTFAKEHGILIKYDRLAVAAVSIFHLSHWRCNVTVNNYLMAVDLDT